MKWEEPALVEINMSAEVGAYQEDFEERDEPPAFASPAAQQLATSSEG
jgi:hypothetical protein